MKLMIACALALGLSACTSDQMMRLGGCPQIKPNEIPSGCQIRGATYYNLEAGYVRQVASRKSADEMLRSWRSNLEPGQSGGP